MRKNWSRRYSGSVIALALASALAGCAGASKPMPEGRWATYLHDDARSNATQEDVRPPLEVAWDRGVSDFRLLRPFPKEQLSTPAIAGGRLYVGSTNSTFYAVDLSNGAVKWSLDAGSPVEASPAVSDSMVCFGGSDGVLRCLDHDGRLLWKFQARSEILSSPVIGGGRVYFNSSDDRAYALDARTGEKVWTYMRGTYRTVTPRIYGSPAHSEAGSLYYFFSDGALVRITAVDGKEAWVKKIGGELDTSHPVRRTPLADGALVYAIDENGAVVALSEDTGELKGLYNIVKARDFALPDSKTLVVAGEGQVLAIDRTTGVVLWKSEIKDGQASSVLAAGGHVFVLSNFKQTPFGIEYLSSTKGRIQALRLKDGSPVWEKTLGSEVSASASAAASRVALLTNDGDITVFGPK